VAIRRRGRDNDLINLLQSVPPLADIAVETHRRRVAPGGRNVDVGTTEGAFQESAKALPEGATEFSFARPYATDFLGWLDDFSTTGGGFDALGAMGRGHISLAENVSLFNNGSLSPSIAPGPPRKFQYKRCPGAAEAPAADGSNVLSQDEQDRLQCKDSDRSVGDVP
jgi:phospholipid/cholesterol/gamma-HCH transport system substrate-binding protein